MFMYRNVLPGFVVKCKERELTTNYLNRNQKSFYGKARIIETENGTVYLQSYATIVCKIENGQFLRCWAGYSATTAKHIDAFRRENGLAGISKKEWDKLPVVGI